ncbi:hypothetical protein M406DRAFT_17941, partial [Cryphonectria parasitica EP155]
AILSQIGKVFIVTGGSNGLAYELTRQLYGAGAKVNILTRSKERTEAAISKIKAYYDDQDARNQRGSLEFVHMNLMNIGTIKAAAQDVLDREGPGGRLDVLPVNFIHYLAPNNPPLNVQGHKHHFAVDMLGSNLLTKLLWPIHSKTAESTLRGSVRVTRPGSILVELGSPKGGV